MELPEAANGRPASNSGLPTFLPDRCPRQNGGGANFRVGHRFQLGRSKSTRHVTQYSVDVRRQLSDINDEILSDECIPFRHCPHSSRCAVVVWVWSLIRSETFLYLLHISSIVFGAVNSGLF